MPDIPSSPKAAHVPRKQRAAKVVKASMDPLWSVDEVAAYLGVSVQTIYDWRVQDIAPPAYKVGKYLRFIPDDVRAFVMKRPA